MELTLEAEIRHDAGKGVARKLRAAGKVPGVVYGAGSAATAIAVDRRTLTHALATDAGLNVLIDLKVGSDTYLTLARELQRDPIRGDIKHVDFVKIDRDTAIEVEIPIHVEGDSRGVREGGVVEHHIWTVRVSCKPGNVPGSITVDITDVGLHEHVKVGQLTAPEGVEILTDPEENIVTIATPQVLKLEAELEQPGMEPAAEGVAEPAAAEAAEVPPAAEGGEES
ncbi:MAG TPA: 50S ribosomal protein L25 [Actinomycetota bacterium]